MKPQGLSRGRGIYCTNNISEMLSSIKDSNPIKYVVQKYIEKTLLINKRKFDMRQWILITSLKPLKIYRYSEPYIRVSAHDYDPEDRPAFEGVRKSLPHPTDQEDSGNQNI